VVETAIDAATASLVVGVAARPCLIAPCRRFVAMRSAQHRGPASSVGGSAHFGGTLSSSVGPGVCRFSILGLRSPGAADV
jgi:hypothetical protein